MWATHSVVQGLWAGALCLSIARHLHQAGDPIEARRLSCQRRLIIFCLIQDEEARTETAAASSQGETSSRRRTVRCWAQALRTQGGRTAPQARPPSRPPSGACHDAGTCGPPEPSRGSTLARSHALLDRLEREGIVSRRAFLHSIEPLASDRRGRQRARPFAGDAGALDSHGACGSSRPRPRGHRLRRPLPCAPAPEPARDPRRPALRSSELGQAWPRRRLRPSLVGLLLRWLDQTAGGKCRGAACSPTTHVAGTRRVAEARPSAPR